MYETEVPEQRKLMDDTQRKGFLMQELREVQNKTKQSWIGDMNNYKISQGIRSCQNTS